MNLWKQEYLLEIESIDEQHQRFFELCTELAQVAERCRTAGVERKTLIRAIFDLRLYAFFHFNTEENLMVQRGYQGCLKHFKEHDAYLGRLRGFMDKLGQLPEESAPEAAERAHVLATEISDWAADWWGEHILEYDREYAAYIKNTRGNIS